MKTLMLTRKVLVEKYTIIKSIAYTSIFSQSLLGNHYKYKSHKVKISLVYPCSSTMNMYEIYCPELFEDIERYDTVEEVEERISELLL